MSATSKQLLKAVGAAVQKQQWDAVIEGATEVIGRDPKNYQAYACSLTLLT